MLELSLCLEYLHRHPREVNLSLPDLLEIQAYDRIKQREIDKELEKK